MNGPTQPRASRRYTIALVWLAAFAVFALTAYPTITWWDSSSHSLAAATLGVTPPPGSLLLTLIGWVVTRIPTGLAPAHALNLLAGALAATTVGLVLAIGLRLLRRPGDGADMEPGCAPVALAAGAASGVLAFAFSPTLWQYAVQFTPYVLTSVVTGLILWTMLRWWDCATDQHSWRWLLLLGLLFGLDYSVHRTNALLLPGVLLWISIRQPRALRTTRTWIAGAVGLAAGASVQLLIIPLAAAHPLLDIGNPSTWSRFYDYESLAQFGGGFLVQFYPRHAALWSVQAMDFIRAFGANFLWLSGPWGILGILPTLLGLTGWFALWRRDRRLAIAFGALLALHAVVTVLYFNIPANFFRPFDRHYLPVFVTFAVLVCCGAGEVAIRLLELSRRARWQVARWATALLVLVPLSQLTRSWRAENGSHRTFAADFATNLLNGLPARAMLFTWGDNDTWPLMYMQAVAHVRSDVQIVNLSLTNTPWYLDELKRGDPSFPLSRGWAPPKGAQPWTDTTVVIPVAGTAFQLGLADTVAVPRSITVDVAPTIAAKYVLPQDLVLLQILETNGWRRPLCFSSTGPVPGLPGLTPYARLDGIFWRVMPVAHPSVDRAALRRALFSTYAYGGYADAGTPLDEIARRLGFNYYTALAALLRAEQAAGQADQCRSDRDSMLRALPPARLQLDAKMSQEIEAACTGPEAVRP
jgi:hypothetical protein